MSLMKVTLYYKPTCGTCQKVMKALKEKGAEITAIEYLETSPSESELDAILVCTVTPDMLFPSTACLVQHQIGATRAWGFDLVAACSGFLYGLTTAAHLVAAGTHNKVLVIGSDTMSRIIDYTDRSTCVLFGDGAGAMLIEPLAANEDQRLGFIDFIDQGKGVINRLPVDCRDDVVLFHARFFCRRIFFHTVGI